MNAALNSGCNGFSFGIHCVEQGDRIPPLRGYGQKDCFSGVLGPNYTQKKSYDNLMTYEYLKSNL